MCVKFTVAKDPDYGWIVLDAAVKAKSFAMVPCDFAWSFATKAEAVGVAAVLTALPGPDVASVATRMIETPDRFEAVADTAYGAAWA